MNDELAELRIRLERLTQLYQVGKVIHSTLDPHDALRLILGEAVRLTRATSGSVVLVNPTTDFLEIQAAHGLAPAAAALKLRVGEGITGWVARTGRSALVADVTADARYIMVRDGVRSELAVPLEVDGELRGVLNVDADRVGAFSADDQTLLSELAAQAARVIHNTWLYEQLRLKARWFESLFQIGQTINSAVSLDEVLQLITREGAQLMDARLGSLRLLDETREWLDLKACWGGGPAYLAAARLSVAESLMGTVVRRRKAVQEENVQASTRYQRTEIARSEGLVALLSVPLAYRGQAIGTLSVYRGEPHVFSNEEVRALTALAELSAMAIEKARLHERIVEIEDQMRRSERLSALGLLAAEVAHEIRNPLTVMKMLYHSLDLRFPAADPRAQDARIMGEKMEHLNRIVEQILAFARGAEPKLAPVNLNRLLDDLTLLARHKLSQQSIQVERQLAPNLPQVMADAGQLEQVFLNLILNAVEAMPRAGRLILRSRALTAPRSRPAPTHVLVEIGDTGPGMTSEQRQRAFASLLNTTKTSGTGLGLAIVAKIVEAHHGRIAVRSRPERGTTFSLTLPVSGGG